MSSTNYEMDFDYIDYGDWCEGEDIDSRIEENNISNDYFLIHNVSEIEFREYIINKINDIISSLNSIRK